MKAVFADTSYYLALVNSLDEHHSIACQWTSEFSGTSVTTAWVITELANAMSQAANRPFFLSLLRDLQNDARVKIVPPATDIFNRGLDLFARRPDKDWSLTDCISFLVMEDLALRDAATLDRHFSQAGFNVLFPSRVN
jgi:uncharacterized protein